MMRRQKTVAPVSLSALFIAFLSKLLRSAACWVAGWSGHGALPSNNAGWISEEEFTDILAVCQFMPGPNIVGIAVCLGAKLREQGLVAAASRLRALIPLAVGFLLGVIYLSHSASSAPFRMRALAGLPAAAAGLLIATGIRMLIPSSPSPISIDRCMCLWCHKSYICRCWPFFSEPLCSALL